MKSAIDLINAARTGDPKAVAELWWENLDLVRHMIRAAEVSREEDIDDICQDVFVLYQSKLRELREPSAFSTWLARVSKNCAISWQRARHEDLPLEEEPNSFLRQDTEDPLRSLVDDERRRFQLLFMSVVERAVAKLEVSDRVLVKVYFINRQPMKTVLEELNEPGLTAGACYMRVLRVFPKFSKAVRKLLEADDDDMRSLRQYAEVQDWLQQLSNARKQPRKSDDNRSGQNGIPKPK